MNIRSSLLFAGALLLVPGPFDSSLAAEPSVKPGINDRFLDPDLKVGEWVERFEREGREVYDHRERIVREAGLQPGWSVADVGAGTGLFIPLLSQAVGKEGQVLAVDIVPRFLEHIRKSARRHELGNIDTIHGGERSAHLKPNSVDAVFICDTYHHFEYPAEMLNSIHQALKPGGLIVLVEFKRIEGVSSDWALQHVRAGEEVFTKEIVAAGFEKVGRLDFLQDNYILHFRKTAAGVPSTAP